MICGKGSSAPTPTGTAANPRGMSSGDKAQDRKITSLQQEYCCRHHCFGSQCIVFLTLCDFTDSNFTDFFQKPLTLRHSIYMSYSAAIAACFLWPPLSLDLALRGVLVPSRARSNDASDRKEANAEEEGRGESQQWEPPSRETYLDWQFRFRTQMGLVDGKSCNVGSGTASAYPVTAKQAEVEGVMALAGSTATAHSP